MTEQDLERLRLDLTHVACWLAARRPALADVLLGWLERPRRSGRGQAVVLLDREGNSGPELGIHADALRALAALGHVLGTGRDSHGLQLGKPAGAVSNHERLLAVARVDGALRA